MKKIIILAALVCATAISFAQSTRKTDTAKKIQPPPAYKLDPNKTFTVLLTGTAEQLLELNFAATLGIPQIDRTDYNLKLRDQAKTTAGVLNMALLQQITDALKSDHEKFQADSLKALKKKKDEKFND